MGSIPAELRLLTPAQAGELDRRTAARCGGLDGLMFAAGRAVARAVMRHERRTTVLVLCGPGNNGGDGYVAARILAGEGWAVAVAALDAPRDGTPAARAAAGWRGPVVPFAADEAARAGLVVDAVFGAGLSRPLDDRTAAVLRAARRTVAVDVPSGMDGETGTVDPAVAAGPAAAMTVTFGRAKPGHLLLPGRERLGRLVLVPIGQEEEEAERALVRAWRNAPGLWQLPAVGVDTHKYARGVVNVCGGAAMPGAARLSASGARGAGAGLVRIAAEHGAELYRLGDPGLIVDGEALDTLLGDERRKVWVCGPGLTAQEVRSALPALLRSGKRVVADAGALTEAAGAPERLRGVAVATPHAGEFARVFGEPGTDKVAAVRRAAALIDGVVVCKGPDTVIAAPDGRVAINDHATPWLGTAGSGDVLSGAVAACLAAGMAAFEAAAAAVWLHGEAGIRAGEGLLAEMLEPALIGAVADARRRGAAIGTAPLVRGGGLG